MSKIQATVPGKVILHGEHSVVYGKAAIATSVGLHTTTTVSVAQDGGVDINLVSLGIHHCWDIQPFYKGLLASDSGSLTIQEIYGQLKATLDDLSSNPKARHSSLVFLALYLHLLRSFQKTYCPLQVEVSSDIPIGAGLGSSAAFSVGAAATLLAHVDPGLISNPLTDTQRRLISQWAYKAECLFHGKPSGIDNAICTLGGALLFKSGKIVNTLSSAPPIRLLLVDTKESRNTRALVDRVKTLKERHPAVVENILEALEELALESWEDLSSGQTQKGERAEGGGVERWSELWQVNQGLLSALGVSHPKLDDICGLAAQAGMAAKLTGAGGGGFAIVLIPPGLPQKQASQLKDTLTARGYQVYEADIFTSQLQLCYL